MDRNWSMLVKPRAIALIVKEPVEIYLDFLSEFKHYDIYIIIDSLEKINTNTYQNKYKNINFIQFDEQLCKNNGRKDGKQNHIQYDIGDNDFYWLNCDDKKTFFVIPEKVLINKEIVGNNNKRSMFFKITIKELLHKRVSWLQPYMFNYENLDKERLLTTLNI